MERIKYLEGVVEKYYKYSLNESLSSKDALENLIKSRIAQGRKMELGEIITKLEKLVNAGYSECITSSIKMVLYEINHKTGKND